jgi:hypothetical protein
MKSTVIKNHNSSLEIPQEKNIYSEIKKIIEQTDSFNKSKPLQNNFKENKLNKLNWKTEYNIKKNLRPELQKDWKYDVYLEENKIAIEIERGGQCYRDLLKFMLGRKKGVVDIGVLICPNFKLGKNNPSLIAKMEIEDCEKIINLPLLLIGVS